ncbi:fimbrial biogenesis outer membrane usher protein [Caballeronia sp. LZ065]|uniref:fimbria/pilus outer membrane usher protein n=1 Tax=Caballeronia sp. LZ065 TaxID=3038571 RepID=UPI0028543739|nr:fimbria/pilus outer membrane usher protein [Caballeronia sp. LZ065]MDR5778894.1 fimbrial biogenesis outer membrane usher protein [Caballeronia sp. LZ065]
MKKNRCSRPRASNRDVLSLSPAGVAVLLAVVAAHARADSAALPPANARPDAAAPTGEARALASREPAAPESATVRFNARFLSGSAAAQLDISRFDRGNLVAAGTYHADLYVNQTWIGTTDITLREVNGPGTAAQPLFDRALLTRIGVDFTKLGDAARARLDTAKAALLPELIPGASAVFDMGEQRLDVSVPQASMNRTARGWIDPKFWDDGVPAALVQYSGNVYRANGNGVSNTQGYLGVNAGVNLGPWRFRYGGNLTGATNAGVRGQSIQSNAQRSIARLKSQFTLGDTYTDGSVFDSFGLRGVQIGTDDRMVPESQRGYAPTVRGIANTNARVQVTQRGNLIYETTVAPGPFEIDDLYATGYGGDLQVTVTEADGSRHTSLLPYAAPVNALREGRWRYSVAAGQYRNATGSNTPFVLQGNVQHGLNRFMTLYGGTIVSSGYGAVAAGVALDTPVGAFGFDVTQANTSLPNVPSRGGQSLRVSYSRSFAPLRTDVTLAAYRYSTQGFLSFADAMTLRDAATAGNVSALTGRQKGRLLLTVNQSLRDYGSMYLSGSTQIYWNRSSRDTSFQAGYNTSIRRVGVNVSVSRELDSSTARWGTRFMMSLSVPLSLGARHANSVTSFTRDSRDGSSQLQSSFTGAAGANHRLNYGVTTGRQWRGAQTDDSVNANLGFLSSAAQMQLNAGRANGYTQVGGGLSGSIVAYGGGVVVSPQSGDTFAVIEADAAAGANVSSAPGVRIDRHGHALIAGLQPYALNQVGIDMKGLPIGLRLKTTEQRFAPTAGSVVRVQFDTEDRGPVMLVRIRRPDGQPVPFGAEVLNPQGDVVGTVGQGSRALVYGRTGGDEWTVKWGEGAGGRCRMRVEWPAASKARSRAIAAFAEASCR